MAKKEFPEKLAPKDKEAPVKNNFGGGLSGDFSSKISGLSSKLFGVTKVILAILILPFVYSSVVSFLNEFAQVDKYLQQIFWNGTITFLAVYLFIWEPVIIYNRGHKLLEIMFSFFKPMVNVAHSFCPYTRSCFLLFTAFYR
jgi:hypothetical protein